MKTSLMLVVLSLFIFAACDNTKKEQTSESSPEQMAQVAEVETNQGKALIKKMVAACGGTENFWALKDVEYEYTYDASYENKKDVSIERYVFDGELSWAEYTTREKHAFPDKEGKLLMGYDGFSSWCTMDGQLMQDSATLRVTDFMRKTNFYWFTMMYKLLDPGLNYEYQGKKTSNDMEYDIVKVTFGENVGDAQDIYVLYINPQTKMVDQFLFTVMDFGREEPLMMYIEYQTVDGVMVPKYRKYAPSDWDGNIMEEKWTENYFDNVKFNNNFTPDQFKQPVS